MKRPPEARRTVRAMFQEIKINILSALTKMHFANRSAGDWPERQLFFASKINPVSEPLNRVQKAPSIFVDAQMPAHRSDPID